MNIQKYRFQNLTGTLVKRTSVRGLYAFKIQQTSSNMFCSAEILVASYNSTLVLLHIILTQTDLNRPAEIIYDAGATPAV